VSQPRSERGLVWDKLRLSVGRTLCALAALFLRRPIVGWCVQLHLSYDDERQFRALQDTLSDAAQHPPLEATASVSRHGDQVAALNFSSSCFFPQLRQ